MSNALNIFQSLKAKGYYGIQDMVTNKQEENLFLDFKLKSDQSVPGVQGDDKNNYAKALSGFSNSNGGILIWGINARKENKESPDIACEEVPITFLRKFLTDLNGLTSQAIIPLNPGIENVLILLPDEEDKGFVVTYVPESSLPPHRALLRVNQYFTRSGDSFLMMEHHLLADSFGRRQRPSLTIDYRIETGARFGDGTVIGGLVVGVKNVGRYLATYPAIRIKAIKGNLLPSFYNNANWVFRPGIDRLDGGHLFAGTFNDVIHPNTSIDTRHYQAASCSTIWRSISSR